MRPGNMKNPFPERLHHARSIIVMPKNTNHWQVLEDTIVKPFTAEGGAAREAALAYARKRAGLIKCEINVVDRFGNIMQTIPVHQQCK